jgi:transcriptional repressor NrdR
MKCPICQFEDTAVLETRLLNEGATIKRRRKCLKCKGRFNTLEKLDGLEVMVKKRNTIKEPFDRSKIKKGLEVACEKRSIKESVIEGLVSKIEEDVMSLGVRVVESKKIGELVMGYLKELDQVAYLRFASVCNDFDDISYFEQELKSLKKNLSYYRSILKKPFF